MTGPGRRFGPGPLVRTTARARARVKAGRTPGVGSAHAASAGGRSGASAHGAGPRPHATPSGPRGALASDASRALIAGRGSAFGATDQQLADYERGVIDAFDRIKPTLKAIAACQHERDFERTAQALAEDRLGHRLPAELLADAWITGLDLPRLYAFSLFRAVESVFADFYDNDPLGGQSGAEAFATFLQECGFHAMDISPCADGRLAHVVSYVLRLPCGGVRRHPHAGALFDIEDSVSRWVQIELGRFREGVPNTADAPTRYLKVAIYHYSSRDPNAGCAAHGGDTRRAMSAALERLEAFRTAIQNAFCCGASIDLLLLGLDTDTDALTAHLPDAEGNVALERRVSVADLTGTGGDLARLAERLVETARGAGASPPANGMVRLLAQLFANNLAHLAYLASRHGGAHGQGGHAERFIGAGQGFGEIQLRNLTYLAYLDTVEEGAADLDVGVGLFRGLNLRHGLPVPVVVRLDFDGRVPGAQTRAEQRCERVAGAIRARYADLAGANHLHTLTMVKDASARTAPITLADSACPAPGASGH